MRFHATLRRAGLTMTACATLALLHGCSEDTTQPDKSGTFYSSSQNLGNGTAKAYVTLDRDGNPTEVGIRMTEEALNGLPDSLPTPSQNFTFHLPEQASATIFDHVMLDWNHHGHEPPGIFDVPHFDLHFYSVDTAYVGAIDTADAAFRTKAANLPESKYIPQDYIVPGPPDSSAVPFMGLHWLDMTDSTIAPGLFEEVFIYGSWNGEFIFMEPMLTRAWLVTKPTLHETIKLPSAFKKSGYHPTTYNVHFDSDTKEYVISLGGMTMRQAS